MVSELKVDLKLRKMTKDDIAFGMKLKNIAKWNQIEKDWKRFVDLEPEGCFVGEVNNEKVGTITTVSYEKKFAWIGMVLVPPEWRRKGIGTTLLTKAIKYLQEIQIEVIRLDATPMGKKVYDTLGFKDEYRLERRQGTGIKCESKNAVAMTPKDLKSVYEFDGKHFGGNRARILEKLFNEYPELCFVSYKQNNLSGYLMARPGYNAHQIGPWIAEDGATADELFKRCLDKLCDKKIFFDIPLINPDAINIVNRYNFGVQRDFIRMYLGENKYPGIPDKVYAISGVEKG